MRTTSQATLIRHVRNSNLIERIVAFPGELPYDNHLHAANKVTDDARNGICTHPNVLHAILLDGLLPAPGSYRDNDVRVGHNPMPRQEMVPVLMEEWWHAVNEAPSILRSATEKERKNFIFLLHDSFLCIHPYRDGNGRTARLLLNVFGLRQRMPWHIVHASSREEYYRYIRYFEESYFRKIHPDVY